MPSHGKRLRRILAGILIVLVVLVLLATLRLGTIIKTAVNTAGPALLGVPVTVDSVSVFPYRGEVDLRALTIGNPDGYGSEYLFRLDRMRLELVLADLFKGVLNVVAGAGGLAVDGVKGAGSLAADGVMGAGKAVGGVISGFGGIFKGGASTTNVPPVAP